MKDTFQVNIMATSSQELDFEALLHNLNTHGPGVYVSPESMSRWIKDVKRTPLTFFRENVSCREALSFHVGNQYKKAWFFNESGNRVQYIARVESGLFPTGEKLSKIVERHPTLGENIREHEGFVYIYGYLTQETGILASLLVLLLRLRSIADLIGFVPEDSYTGFMSDYYVELISKRQDEIDRICITNYGASPGYFGMDKETLERQLMYLFIYDNEGVGRAVDPFIGALGRAASVRTDVSSLFYSTYGDTLRVDEEEMDMWKSVRKVLYGND